MVHGEFEALQKTQTLVSASEIHCMPFSPKLSLIRQSENIANMYLLVQMVHELQEFHTISQWFYQLCLRCYICVLLLLILSCLSLWVILFGI